MLHRLASSQGGLRVRSAAGLLMLVLATSACVAQPSRVSPLKQSTAPVAQQEQAAVIELRAGELPNVTLTGSILFRLLASDISVQRGELVAAADTLLELARETADPRLAQRAVELYAAVGNLQGALEAAKVWVANAPGNEDALSTRMALSAAAGQTQGLVDELAKQIRQASNKTEAMARAMGVLSRMQDRALALRLMGEAIDKSKTRGTLAAHMALADMAQAAGDHQRALLEARAALRLKSDSEDAAMRVLDYGMSVDPNTAIADGRRFARANPKSRQLRLMLAGKLAETGDVEAALEELRLMSAQFPEDFDLLFIRAQLAYRDKRLKEADRLLQEYVDVQSQRQDALAAGASDAGVALADAYTLLSRIAQDQGDAERAIALLGKIEDPSAKYPARLRQATIRASQGRVDEAVRMIDAAHSGDLDEQLIGVLTLTRILREAQRYDQAIERLLQADYDIQDSVEIKYELGMLLERQKRYAEMEKYIRQVIELDPGYAHAYNALGYSLADRNERLKEADELIARAYQILPQDPHILDSVGWVKFRLGDNAQAEKYLRAAFEQLPQAEVAAHLGEVLWVQGRRDEAREIWRQGQELDPGNAVLQDTMRRFGVSP
jgi:tetratricopeptide (TPR) repeat protein